MTTPQRPNIVMVITHDTGDYLGCYGHDVRTPHLDTLAEQGILFSRYFCSAPQCSPSRASILSGLFPHRNGMMGLAHRGWELHPEVRCLPQYLAAAGYRTHLFGFQHESEDPFRLGYQQVVAESHRAGPVARAVRQFLETRPAGPFFLMAGFEETHRPFNKPGYEAIPAKHVRVPPYLPDIPPVREELGQLQGLLAAADNAIGEIRAAIALHPEAENTLFIYTTDHGVAMPRAKGTLFDPGVRTALLMHWPTGLRGKRTVDALLSNVDLLPTLLDAAGAAVPHGLDGRSFFPLLHDRAYRARDHVFLEMTWHDRYNPVRGVRTARHKYIHTFIPAPRVYLPRDILEGPSGRALAAEYYGTIRPEEELYDLQHDPLERCNRIPCADDAVVARSLRGLVRDWMLETDDPLLRGDVPGQPGDTPGWGDTFPPAGADHA